MYKSKKKNRSSSQNPYNQNRSNQMDNFFRNFISKPFFGIDEFSDPFEDMFFGGRMGGNINNLLGDMESEFSNMNDMIRVNNQNRRGVNKGTMISQSYISKIDYSSGQPVKESYQSRSIKQIGDHGHRISEKQEAYKNSNGIQKAAHQRMLDNKGAKLIKQRNKNTGEQEEHNIYKGINDDEIENFNREYNDYRQKVGFERNYEMLNNMGRGGNRRLGNGNNGNNGNYGNYGNAPLALPSGNNFNRRSSYNDGYEKKRINKMKRRK